MFERPYHDCVQSRQTGAYIAQKQHGAKGSAGNQVRQSGHQPSGIVGMKPVDILCGVDRIGDALGSNVWGQGELNQNAVNRRVRI